MARPSQPRRSKTRSLQLLREAIDLSSDDGQRQEVAGKDDEQGIVERHCSPVRQGGGALDQPGDGGGEVWMSLAGKCLDSVSR